MRRCFYCDCENGKGKQELRPYGPNGSDICFSCMMEKPEREKEAIRNFKVQLDACGDVAVIDGSTVGPYPIRKGNQ